MTAPDAAPPTPRRPDRAVVRAWIRMVGVFYAVFLPVYFGAGAVAAHADRARVLAFPFEAGIPLVPWMIWPYLSIGTLFLLPLFHLEVDDIDRLSRRIAAAIVVAGVAFVALPQRMLFPPRRVDGLEAPLFALLDAVDTPHNLAPSLHVAIAGLIVLAVLRRAPSWLAALYALWFAILSASTVLVHQHHLVDVAAGLALALAATAVRRPGGGGRAATRR